MGRGVNFQLSWDTGRGFYKENFSFAQVPEGGGAGGIRALGQHGALRAAYPDVEEIEAGARSQDMYSSRQYCAAADNEVIRSTRAGDDCHSTKAMR